MHELSCDVCVIGGGPAGSVAAFYLATLGHRVCLVEREAFPRAHVGESLSPGIRPVLDSLGLSELLAHAAFRASGETQICWAEPRPQRVLPAAKHGGLLVDRGEFDQRLVQAARSAGVRVVQPAKAVAARAADGWSVEARTRESMSIAALRLIDAAGRSGCVAGRRIAYAPVTLAVWVHLETGDDPVSRVEAIPEGWLWAAPIAERRTSLMLFCDARVIKERTRRRDLERWLRARLAKTVLFSGWTRVPFAGAVIVCDATCAYAPAPIGAGYLKIGDANFTLDPLSSTGVEKALQTAIAGAVVTHTLLQHPERHDLCARFYEDRQRDAVATHAAWTREYYDEVQRYAAEPFWAVRLGPAPSSPALLARTPERRDAPDSTTAVRLASDVSITEEPCIVGDTIDLRRALRSPALSRPLVFLGGVEVAPLLTDVVGSPKWSALLDRWSRRMPASSAARLAAWLWDRRVLCEAPADGRR